MIIMINLQEIQQSEWDELMFNVSSLAQCLLKKADLVHNFVKALQNVLNRTSPKYIVQMDNLVSIFSLLESEYKINSLLMENSCLDIQDIGIRRECIHKKEKECNALKQQFIVANTTFKSMKGKGNASEMELRIIRLARAKEYVAASYEMMVIEAKFNAFVVRRFKSFLEKYLKAIITLIRFKQKYFVLDDSQEPDQSNITTSVLSVTVFTAS